MGFTRSVSTPHWRVLRGLLQTTSSPIETALRMSLALVLLPHGAQHLLGAFDGFGFRATLDWMTGTLRLPTEAALLGIAIEFVAPLALIVGAGTRLAAVALALFMAVAASTHTANGFFMNWVGQLPAGAEGFEYHVLAIALAVAVGARGAGAWSLDNWLTHGTAHAPSRVEQSRGVTLQPRRLQLWRRQP
jgi:putative oxidoreductase